MAVQDEARTSEASSGRRVVTQFASLDALVGAHPDALEKIYRSGRPADPAELGDAPIGRLLALAPAGEVFLAARPIVRALGHGALPWRGKTFDHGGNSGQNVVFGQRMFRFRAEVAPSEVDGKPTLRLAYAEPAYKNPWPIRAVFDELRSAGPGVAIGPAFLASGGAARLLLWFGLQNPAVN
ncbi:MAG TPA: hypothetical protein VGM56_24900 [Byssovorax sp.]|jgi:hypothetical protein